jgi:hypothetical protein
MKRKNRARSQVTTRVRGKAKAKRLVAFSSAPINRCTRAARNRPLTNFAWLASIGSLRRAAGLYDVLFRDAKRSKVEDKGMIPAEAGQSTKLSAPCPADAVEAIIQMVGCVKQGCFLLVKAKLQFRAE